MQVAIPQELSALMALEQGMRQGTVAPTTPQGSPTVAAQMANAVQQQMIPQMPPSAQGMPGIQNVAQQAGLAGQIQAMQQQQAQQALMQQAMAQRPPAGIEGLNPQMGNFAHGGIVGYAVAGEAEDEGIDPGSEAGGMSDEEYERRLRNLRRYAAYDVPAAEPRTSVGSMEGLRNVSYGEAEPRSELPSLKRPTPAAQEEAAKRVALANIPIGPMGKQVSAESPSAGMFNAARARLGQQVLEPVSPAQGIEAALALGQAQDELRRRMGLPSEMERISKEGEEFSKLYGERGQRLAERISQLESERKQQGIINFLLGARGMRGQGIGEVFRTGAESSRAYEEATRGRIEKMQDLQLEVRGLQLEKQTALAKMKDDIANGRFKDAMANKQKAQDAQNGLLKAYAEIDLAQGKELGAEWRTRVQAQQQPGELERLLSRLSILRQTSPEAAKQLEEDIAVLRGAGRRPAPAELRQRLLEQYADNWEKMDLMEKRQLMKPVTEGGLGIKTYEDYVKYRDRIAGVAPTGGGSSTGQVLKFDARGNLIQ